jgi:hypothetical protein
MKKRNQKTSESPITSLYRMLEYRRPSGSKSVDEFINTWIKPLGAKPDKANNWILRIGDSSRVLWSSHTDSVHSYGGKQKIVINGDKIRLANGEKSNCLGADCATGIWIMREMILAGVHGLYIFHDSEEIGGIGSSYIANKTPHILDGIDYAIAFDRRGSNSIVTHQASSRCASDLFADSISKLLPSGYAADSGGVFTDTANFSYLIPECTNLGVGYENQHTASETQSIKSALALRDAMLRFDESKLVASRDPAEIDYEPYDYWHNSRDTYYNDWHELERIIKDHPHMVADYLDSCGVTADHIRRWYQ